MRQLTYHEKIQDIREYGMLKRERKDAAAYMFALYRNNIDVVNYYESFGRTPRHIFLNKYSYECGLIYGFTDFTIDVNGWIQRPKFENIEEFEFKAKNEKVSHNYIRIGKGANDKWTNALSYSYGNGGGGYGLSVFSIPYDSRKEALVAILKDFIGRHHKERDKTNLNDSEPSYKKDYSKPIVAQAQDMHDKLLGNKHEQMSIFDL